MKRICLIFLMTTGSAFADTGCPAPPDHNARMNDLILAAQIAPNESAARKISNQMWELWADAPDETAQALLDEGMSRRASYDFNGALKALDALVDYCPDYAEGYNQRAFVNFLTQDYATALSDLDQTLILSPRHVGALSGKALTLMGLDRHQEAQLTLKKAVDLNPWLSERHLLNDPIPSPRTDL